MEFVKKKDLIVFALIWAGIFIIIGLYPIINSEDVRTWSLVIGMMFIVVSIFQPNILTVFYHIWIKVGEFIGGIISKIAMFILYFGLFTPISFVLKILGKDLLKKKIDKQGSSYWIDREMQPQSMKNQF